MYMEPCMMDGVTKPVKTETEIEPSHGKSSTSPQHPTPRLFERSVLQQMSTLIETIFLARCCCRQMRFLYNISIWSRSMHAWVPPNVGFVPLYPSANQRQLRHVTRVTSNIHPSAIDIAGMPSQMYGDVLKSRHGQWKRDLFIRRYAK